MRHFIKVGRPACCRDAGDWESSLLKIIFALLYVMRCDGFVSILLPYYTGRSLGFYQISTSKKNSKYRPNIDHTAFYRPNIDRKSSLKSAYLHISRQKCECFFRAGLYPISQEIYVKQGAGSYFHINSFNGSVIKFQVLRFIIFRIIEKIYQQSKRF